jgi:hypothetical protein
MQTRFCCGNVKDRDILKDLVIDGIIMDLREKGRTAWTGLFCPRIGTVGCCSEHGNVIWNTANGEESSQEAFSLMEFPVCKHKE